MSNCRLSALVLVTILGFASTAASANAGGWRFYDPPRVDSGSGCVGELACSDDRGRAISMKVSTSSPRAARFVVERSRDKSAFSRVSTLHIPSKMRGPGVARHLIHVKAPAERQAGRVDYRVSLFAANGRRIGPSRRTSITIHRPVLLTALTPGGGTVADRQGRPFAYSWRLTSDRTGFAITIPSCNDLRLRVLMLRREGITGVGTAGFFGSMPRDQNVLTVAPPPPASVYDLKLGVPGFAAASGPPPMRIATNNGFSGSRYPALEEDTSPGEDFDFYIGGFAVCGTERFASVALGSDGLPVTAVPTANLETPSKP
jgi:hypothetical protein